jgi:hypothetical protein
MMYSPRRPAVAYLAVLRTEPGMRLENASLAASPNKTAVPTVSEK